MAARDAIGSLVHGEFHRPGGVRGHSRRVDVEGEPGSQHHEPHRRVGKHFQDSSHVSSRLESYLDGGQAPAATSKYWFAAMSERTVCDPSGQRTINLSTT